MVWCIGNGEKVNVWTDNWLVDDYYPSLVGSNVIAVKDLIDSSSHVWKEELVRSVFNNLIYAREFVPQRGPVVLEMGS